MRACVGRIDVAARKEAANAACCDNSLVHCTPEALLKGIVQPVRRFALSSLTFKGPLRSRMAKKARSDELAATGMSRVLSPPKDNAGKSVDEAGEVQLEVNGVERQRKYVAAAS